MLKKTACLITCAVLLAWGSPLRAQNVIDLVISEAMAQPDETSLLDDYGNREGWIEIYNTSTGTVNLGGCFLTDDKGDLKKSLITKSDLRTQLGPRQVMLFHATGNNELGTFYTSFTLKPGSKVYLVSNDGRTIVDSLAIPATLPRGKSVSKFPLDNKKLRWGGEKVGTPSPMVVNGSQNAESNAEKMARNDPHGFILALVSISVVFSALAILWFLFWLLFERPAKKKAAKAAAPAKKAAVADLPAGKGTDEIAAAIALALDMEGGGDTYAAIALAMHLYMSECAHDQESFVVTIKPSENSAWRAHGRTLRRSPR